MSKNKRFEDSDVSPLFSRIGRRIILIMVLLSSAVTLTATFLQLSWDYSREYSAVERRHDEVESIHIAIACRISMELRSYFASATTGWPGQPAQD